MNSPDGLTTRLLANRSRAKDRANPAITLRLQSLCPMGRLLIPDIRQEDHEGDKPRLNTI